MQRITKTNILTMRYHRTSALALQHGRAACPRQRNMHRRMPCSSTVGGLSSAKGCCPTCRPTTGHTPVRASTSAWPGLYKATRACPYPRHNYTPWALTSAVHRALVITASPPGSTSAPALDGLQKLPRALHAYASTRGQDSVKASSALAGGWSLVEVAAARAAPGALDDSHFAGVQLIFGSHHLHFAHGADVQALAQACRALASRSIAEIDARVSSSCVHDDGRVHRVSMHVLQGAAHTQGS